MKDTNPKLAGNQKAENTKKDQDKEPTLSASFPGLVDLVDKDGEVVYLLMENGNLKVEESSVDSKGKLLLPPGKADLPFNLVPAKRVLHYFENDKDEDLYNDILEALKKVAQLPLYPKEEYYHLVAVYIFFTYLQEEVSYFPYLWFQGLPERGKSRIVKAIANLCHRGLYTETLNQAYIFRFADLLHGTLLIDVYDLLSSAQGKGSYDLLLGRYERGIKTPRVLGLDKGPFKDIVYFETAGPTVLATNVDIPVTDPLRGRCIRIMMPEARGIWANNNSPKDLMDFKTRLVAFRARHIGRELPVVEKLIPGRLGDITQPLLRTARLFPRRASIPLMAVVKNLEKERKESQVETLPGRIARTLHELKGEVEKGRLRVDTVIKKINSPGNVNYNEKVIGLELNNLGIQKIKTGGGRMHIVWESETMERIWDRYGVC
jgi:hypothetical protein